MSKYIRETYNLANIDEDYQATFSVDCIISETGRVMYARISKKSADSYTKADKEMLRVFLSMPNWNPGKCNNKNVKTLIKVPFTIDVSFD